MVAYLTRDEKKKFLPEKIFPQQILSSEIKERAELFIRTNNPALCIFSIAVL